MWVSDFTNRTTLCNSRCVPLAFYSNYPYGVYLKMKNAKLKIILTINTLETLMQSIQLQIISNSYDLTKM